MKEYSVKQLSEISGVTIRTLHHYDNIRLLKPSTRTEAGYRQYNDDNFFRLQQILLYREMEIPLKEIKQILDDPNFDFLEALQSHKKILIAKQNQLAVQLQTINKTIKHLTKENKMLTIEELYEGFPKEQSQAYRQESKKRWGENFDRSEKHLRQMSKEELDTLKQTYQQLWKELSTLCNKSPKDDYVQTLIRRHHEMTAQFWGITPPKDAYIGLGELNRSDPRFTEIDGVQIEGFGDFMYDAMKYYAENNLYSILKFLTPYHTIHDF